MENEGTEIDRMIMTILDSHNIKYNEYSNLKELFRDLNDLTKDTDLKHEYLPHDEHSIEYNPDGYIIFNYTGNSHYELITYKNKTIFKYSELPKEIIDLVKRNCIRTGLFKYIKEFN